MKTLWILAAAATFAACAKGNDEEVGAAPDRGDTTAVTTQVDTATGQWDTTGALTWPVAPADTMSMPADTGMAAPTTPTDTTVGQYPAPSDSTMTQPATPDTSSYVPDTGAAGVDTSAVNPSDPSTGVGTDSTSQTPQ